MKKISLELIVLLSGPYLKSEKLNLQDKEFPKVKIQEITFQAVWKSYGSICTKSYDPSTTNHLST